MNRREEKYFDSWLKDNMNHMKNEFVSLYNDDFLEFCKEKFRELE